MEVETETFIDIEVEKQDKGSSESSDEKIQEEIMHLRKRINDLQSITDSNVRKQYKKIVDMVCEKGGDETDGTEKKMLLTRMKFVINCLHKTSNPFHSFMNVINPGNDATEENAKDGYKSHEEFINLKAKTVIEELEKISKGGYISQEDFINFKAKTTKMGTVKTAGCCGKETEKSRTSEATLLEYIEEIADGKKIYMSWTMLIFFILTLMQFLMYIFIGDWTDRLEFNVNKIDEVWRYFTYSLVHVDLGHLLPNLALFLGLSISLHSKFKNSLLGFFWIFLLYVIGVVSGSLAFYVFDDGTLMGCSGGVYCLLGASFASTLLNWRERKVVLVKWWRNRAPLAFSGRMFQVIKSTVLCCLVALEFGPALWRRVHHEDAGISVVTHVFGFLAGVTMGANLVYDQKEEKWERKVKFVCCSMFCLAFGAALALNKVDSREAVRFFHKNGSEIVKGLTPDVFKDT